MNFFSDNENFERGPPRHAGGNGNQGINFVWPNHNTDSYCTWSSSMKLEICTTWGNDYEVPGHCSTGQKRRSFMS